MSERLKRREEQLKLLVMMLGEMTAMLRYRALPSDELIASLALRPDMESFDFLMRLARLIEAGEPVRESWRRSAEEADFLSEGDRGILYHIGESLGATDIEGQLSMLGISREFAERNLLEAGEEYRSKGGVFRKAGLLCGVALCILIL